MRLRTFAMVAAALLGGAFGACIRAPHAHWLGLKAYAGGKEARQADDATKHRFLKFNTLSLPILDDAGLSQAVSFSVVIEVPDGRRSELVRANEPRLTDAYIHDMYGVWNKDAAYRDGVVHVDVIKDRLSRSSRRILGDENVNDVVLEVVDQRAM
jgi:flagellar FliL protein